MKQIAFITKERFQEVLQTEVKRIESQGKGFIKNPAGFTQHLVGVGQNAEKISLAILFRHPTLQNIMSAEIMRVAGFMHDFSKYDVGDPYHEIEGAYAIIRRGEELELIAGGSKADRKQALKRIARCLPSDGIVFNQLGESPPNSALYPSFFTPDMQEKLEFVRRELSSDGQPLEIAELTSPAALEQKVIIYADYKDLQGKEMPLQARLKEIYDRYNAWAVAAISDLGELQKYRVLSIDVTPEDISSFYTSVPRLLQQNMPETLSVIGTIDELLGSFSGNSTQK